MNISSIGQYTHQINQTDDNAKNILGKIAAMHEYSSLDGATQSIMDGIRSEYNTISQGIQNSNEFSGLLNIADSSLQNMSKSADKLQELSVRYNNDALSSEQRSMLRTEANSIMKSMSDSVSSSTYNGQSVFRSDMKVFDGQSTITANVDAPNMANLNFEDQDSIKSFQESIHATLSNISGSQNQLESSMNRNYKQMVSQSEMYSSGFDLGENVVAFEKEKLLNQSAQYAQSMNTEYIKQQALSLLQ
jgi:flagellin